MSTRSRLRVYFAALLLAAAAVSPLHAANFCVSTGEQLYDALATATVNGQPDEIRIEYGTLTNISAPLLEPRWVVDVTDNSNLVLSGGWTKGNNCASLATESPEATVLDAQYWSPVLEVRPSLGFNAAIMIRNLTLARGKLKNCYPGCFAGLWVNVEALPSASVTVDNVLVRHSQVEAGKNADVAAFTMTGGGTLRLRNSIFMGNDLSAGDQTAGVSVHVDSNTVAYVTNNTIFGNTVTLEHAGLSAEGNVTLSNNAIADNTSTGASPIQFSAYNVSMMTLRNNHFATREYIGGFPIAESGTTTGDAQWTQVGVKMVPNTESVLRDSGLNNPSGGIPGIDFSGQNRIINDVIDRGAVEALPEPPLGPLVFPSSPTNGSTTVVYGEPNTWTERTITFWSGGGTLNGYTFVKCTATAGLVQILTHANQYVYTGSTADDVLINLPTFTSPMLHTVTCTAQRLNGPLSTYVLHFQTVADGVFKNGFE